MSRIQSHKVGIVRHRAACQPESGHPSRARASAVRAWSRRLLTASSALLILVIGALAAAAPGDQRAVVILASFADRANADTAAYKAAQTLAAAIQIEPVVVRGQSFYRVVAELSHPRSDLLSTARAAGFTSAWRTTLPPAASVLNRVEAAAGTAAILVPPTGPGALSPPGARPPQPPLTDGFSISAPYSLSPEEEARERARRERAAAERQIPGVGAALPATTARPERASANNGQTPATGASLLPVRTAPGGETPFIEVPEYSDSAIDITIDGRLDEPVWREVPSYDGMKVIDPDLLADPRFATEVRYLYTNKGLYVSAKMEQPPDTLIARLSSRDAFINRDSFGITLDTSGEGLYGYWFSVNLGGTVLDGKVAPERNFTREWDGPWTGASAELDDGWSVEMFLPWSMMAMPVSDGPRKIGFWTNRKVAYLDERWSTPALPFTSSTFMSTLGTLQMERVNPKQQLAFFPYGSYTLDEIDSEDEYRAGFDVFWRPSPNFQLAAAANPDFGAVESDDVVVNLTAFETFFPEKRLFFLEGNEVFTTSPRSVVRGSGSTSGARRTAANFSPEPTTLLNTRRIGGAPDITVPDGIDVAGAELGKPTELLGAAKVTGQLGGLRYGFLGAAENDVRRAGVRTDGSPVRLVQDGRDFGVARVLYESVGDGRRSIGYLGTLASGPNYDAFVHGVDLHMLSSNGKFSWDTQLIASDVDDVKGYGGFMDFRYNPGQGSTHQISVDFLDDDLDISDLGFLRRNDAYGIRYSFMNRTSRGLKRLRARTWSILASGEYNGDGRIVRGGIFFRNQFVFHNKNEIRTEFNYFPKRYDDRNSLGNGQYKIDDRFVGEVSVGTDSARKISLSGALGAFQEDLSGWQYRASAGVTFKPNDRFSLDLDATYARRDGWLLHQTGREFTTFAASDWRPKLAMDLFLTARQQLRVTMQWAGIRADEQEFFVVPENDGDLIQVTKAAGAQTDDFTISRLTTQVRYRWQIGPLSDLFLVYTRGSNVPNQVDDEFSDLFSEAINEPIIDVFVMKLRYRLGS